MSQHSWRVAFIFFLVIFVMECGTLETKACKTNQECQTVDADYRFTGPGTNCDHGSCKNTPKGYVVDILRKPFRKLFNERCKYGAASGMSDCISNLLDHKLVSMMNEEVHADTFGYKQCPAGFKCESVNTWPFVACEIGFYAKEGSTECDQCKAGSYSDVVAGEECKQCKAGNFSATVGRSTCQECPEGMYSSGSGWTECGSCDAGHVASRVGQTGCDVCPAGRYQVESNHGVCHWCLAGTVQPNNGSQTCNACSKGYHASADGMTECVQCEVGKYQDEEGKHVCKECRTGAFADHPAATECMEAKAGHYSPDHIHENACASGTFQSEVGKSQCESCGDHSCYLDAISGTGCVSVSEGSRACSCVSAGHMPNDEYTQVVPCPAGKHQNLPCQATCDSCDPGKFASFPGSFDCECNLVGHYVKDDGSGIENCSGGTYQDESCSSQACKPCAPGSWSYRGAEQCYCAPKGTQPNDQQDDYEECELGFYADKECSLCVCAPRGHGVNKARTLAMACEPGTYAEQPCQHECKDCEPGKFSEYSAAVGCTCAPKGHTVNDARTQQVECGPGKHAAERCSETCELCPKGRFSISNTSSACESCLKGYAQNLEGSTSCYSCGQGLYSDEAASEECKPCSVSHGAGPNYDCVDCSSVDSYFGLLYPDRCVVAPAIIAIIVLIVVTCLFRRKSCARLCCCRRARAPQVFPPAVQEPLNSGAQESEMSNIVIENGNEGENGIVMLPVPIAADEDVHQEASENPFETSFASTTPSTPVSSKEPSPFGVVSSGIILSNVGCTAERVSGVAYGVCLSQKPLVQTREGFYYEVFIDTKVRNLRAPAVGFAVQRKWSLSPEGKLTVPDAKQLRRVWVAGYDNGCAEFYSDGETSKISETVWRPLKELQEGSIIGVLWVTKGHPELVIYQDGWEKARLKPTGRLPSPGEEIYALVDLLGCVSKATLLQASPPR